MTLVLIFAAAAVLFACWVLYTLATLALPVFAAISVALWAHGAGAGIAVSVLTALAVGVLTLVAGQLSFALVRSPLARIGIGLLYALPAALAGYHAVHGIIGLSVEAEGWRQILSATGGMVVGAAAWLRIAGGGEVVRRIEQSSPSAS